MGWSTKNDWPLFLDPHGENRPAVESMARQVVEELLRAWPGAAERPVVEARRPDQLLEQFSFELPEQGLPLAQVLEEYSQSFVPHSVALGHPRYIGHMDPAPLILASLVEPLVSALNQNLMSHELSPAATAAEQGLMRWFCRLFDLGEAAGGFLNSGGTVANLNALVVARNAIGRHNAFRASNWNAQRPLALLASELSHFSVAKAADVIGLWPEQLHFVPVDASGALDLAELRRLHRQCEHDGQFVFAVVGTAGTTTCGSIDPLAGLAAFCREKKIWFHCDAAYGGALALLPEQREKLAGLSQADSLAFDPHKWLYFPKGTGAIFFRDFSLAVRHFRFRGPYIERQEQINLGEYGIQGTRRFDALKIWLTLRAIGLERLRGLLRQNLEQTALLTKNISARPDLQLMLQPAMNLVCFRYRPLQKAVKNLDSLQEKIQRRIWQEGKCFLSLSALFGQKVLRANLLNPHTSEADLDFILDEVERLGRELAQD